MRGLNLLALIIVVAVIGLVVKNQTVGLRAQPAGVVVPAAPDAAAPAGNVREQSQQIQQQYKQALDAALQQPARNVDDAQ